MTLWINLCLDFIQKEQNIGTRSKTTNSAPLISVHSYHCLAHSSYCPHLTHVYLFIFISLCFNFSFYWSIYTYAFIYGEVYLFYTGLLHSLSYSFINEPNHFITSFIVMIISLNYYTYKFISIYIYWYKHCNRNRTCTRSNLISELLVYHFQHTKL